MILEPDFKCVCVCVALHTTVPVCSLHGSRGPTTGLSDSRMTPIIIAPHTARQRADNKLLGKEKEARGRPRHLSCTG